jgi:glycosyltransferase involved in cell wall biosynthesis
MPPKISVIVTAYNRKEFLQTALCSLVKQSLDKKLFEVILLTNFQLDIEEFSNLNIHHYILEGTVGEYLYKAINLSKGEIITFLDDDDVFLPNKLSRLDNFFTEEFEYYKNNLRVFFQDPKVMTKQKIFHKRLKVITSKALKKPNKYAYNKSSISIRRSQIIKFIDILRELDGLDDWFFFFSFLYEKKKGIYDPEVLTLYRKHLSASSQAVNVLDKNYGFYLNFLDRLIMSFSYIRNIFPNPAITKVIDFQISIFRSRKNLLKNNLADNTLRNDLKTISKAFMHNYNDPKIVFVLMVRVFVAVHWTKLYPSIDNFYVKVSKKMNKNSVKRN